MKRHSGHRAGEACHAGCTFQRHADQNGVDGWPRTVARVSPCSAERGRWVPGDNFPLPWLPLPHDSRGGFVCQLSCGRRISAESETWDYLTPVVTDCCDRLGSKPCSVHGCSAGTRPPAVPVLPAAPPAPHAVARGVHGAPCPGVLARQLAHEASGAHHRVPWAPQACRPLKRFLFLSPLGLPYPSPFWTLLWKALRCVLRLCPLPSHRVTWARSSPPRSLSVFFLRVQAGGPAAPGGLRAARGCGFSRVFVVCVGPRLAPIRPRGGLVSHSGLLL